MGKLFLFALLLVGLAWGLGFDFGKAKQAITGLANRNAGSLTGSGPDGDWGTVS